MAQTTSLGFIGIGNMGRHMASHLIKAGYPVRLHDLRKDAAEPLLAAGAGWAESIAELAKSSDVVFTALPRPQDVEAVALGPGGILENLGPGKAYIDMTTNSATTVRKIFARARELGVDMLDATMSGGVHGAASRQLTLMCGGEPPVFERYRPILESMSDHVVYCGAIGAGAVTKIVNNMIALSVSVLLGEALILGVKAGVDLDTLVSVISTSTGTTWRLASSFPKFLLKGNFQPGFAVDLAVKDLRLAQAMAEELGLTLDCLNFAEDQYTLAQGRGWGNQHSEAVVKLLEEKAGIELRTAKA